MFYFLYRKPVWEVKYRRLNTANIAGARIGAGDAARAFELGPVDG